MSTLNQLAEDDHDDWSDDEPPEDPWERAEMECGQFLDASGRMFCSLIGTEHCDFECPFHGVG